METITVKSVRNGRQKAIDFVDKYAGTLKLKGSPMQLLKRHSPFRW